MSLLKVEGVTVCFGSIMALSNVSLEVDAGSIVGLIGPNGSGKTTLFNLITGLNQHSFEGHITFEDHDIGNLRPDQIKALGLARTFQNIRLFGNMTVLENAIVGMHCRTKTNLLQTIVRGKAINKREEWIKEQVYAALEFFGPRLTDRVNSPAYSLSYANRRRLEIARAIVSQPKLLLLDEPAAGMNPKESEEMMETIGLIRNRGISVVVIEHDMNVIMGISEKIVVLDHGLKIAEGTPVEVRGDQRVLNAYLGGAIILDAAR